MNQKHISVLTNEAINILNIQKNGVYLDLTLGNGGHSSEILKIIKNGQGKLFAFDVDDQAIKASEKILSKISKNYEIIHSNYNDFESELLKRKITKVDGILMDLGVSQIQLNGSRGFSYNIDSKLDMRMDQNNDNLKTAEFIVNNYSERQLREIFIKNADEEDAYKIAKNIVKIRSKKHINTTFELVNIIKKSKIFRKINKHPAKKVFQAIRIEVNDELNILYNTLPKLLNFLNKNGVLAVISFHSLEDRIVKYFFNNCTRCFGDRNDDQRKTAKKVFEYMLLTKRVITPNIKEIQNNHSAKSAKLRAIKKIF
ncbi:MAG: 16S rRNA (cytosine(1402)-N(4))-methyltransferase RsmH [Bacilli bacterium]|nr:16S rRNA (cytosine(1402)-N(4))-methyltransferase RsmH [Bacilli bacterium]